MAGGFSFDGIDISDLGQEYVPENQETYVFQPASFKMSDETFEGHDGGYVYGETVQPKDFSLRCMYEGAHVNAGQMTRIMHFFRRGRTGRLVFDTRPWCWYVATVVEAPKISAFTNYQNGLCTIRLRAYYPFARTEQTYIYDSDPNETSLINNSAMLKGTAWDLSKNFAATPLTEQQIVYIFNPGTERAALSVEIAGDVGTGVIVTNASTGQKARVVALTQAVSTDAGKVLTIDSLSGKTLLTGNGETGYGFLYHDYGFLDLASNYPILRSPALSGAKNAVTLTSEEALDSSLIGQFFAMRTNATGAVLGLGVLSNFALGAAGDESLFMAEILAVSADGHTITISQALPVAVNDTAMIGSFNKIVVTPETTMNLTTLIFRYKPTFA